MRRLTEGPPGDSATEDPRLVERIPSLNSSIVGLKDGLGIAIILDGLVPEAL